MNVNPSGASKWARGHSNDAYDAPMAAPGWRPAMNQPYLCSPVLIRGAYTIALDKHLVAHLEQRRIALLDRLDRSVTPAYLDHPELGVLLHREARLRDGRNMGVIRAERRLAAQRALHVVRRRRLIQAPVPYGEHCGAVRLRASMRDGATGRSRQCFAVTSGSNIVRLIRIPGYCHGDRWQKDWNQTRSPHSWGSAIRLTSSRSTSCTPSSNPAQGKSPAPVPALCRPCRPSMSNYRPAPRKMNGDGQRKSGGFSSSTLGNDEIDLRFSKLGVPR